MCEVTFVRTGKKVMTEAVWNCLKHMCNISNSSLVRNVDGLLCRRKEDVPADGTGENKVRAPPQKFKVSY